MSDSGDNTVTTPMTAARTHANIATANSGLRSRRPPRDLLELDAEASKYGDACTEDVEARLYNELRMTPSR